MSVYATPTESGALIYASRKLHPAIFEPMQHCSILIAWLGRSSIFLNVADFKGIRAGQHFGEGHHRVWACWIRFLSDSVLIARNPIPAKSRPHCLRFWGFRNLSADVVTLSRCPCSFPLPLRPRPPQEGFVLQLWPLLLDQNLPFSFVIPVDSPQELVCTDLSTLVEVLSKP